MSLQIIVLNTNTQADGSFSVSGVFWLDAPANNIVPVTNFQSQVPKIDPSDLALLKYGEKVERSFSTGLFDSSTSISDVQTLIQSMFANAQNDLNSKSSPLNNLVGAVFDGYNWTTSTPFTNAGTVAISSQYTKINLHWSDFKTFQTNKNGNYQYNSNGSYYTVWFYDGPEVYVSQIYQGAVPSSIVQSGYTQVQNDSDKADFETNYKSNGNKAIVPLTGNGRPQVVSQKDDSSKVTIYSHDWTDPTTWYTTSRRIANETPTNSGDNTTYFLANKNVIDTYHGKLTGENSLVSADGYNYRVSVSVNGLNKNEQNPAFTTGGDFTINYKDGYVIFTNALSPSDAVSVSYNTMVDSVFIIAPNPGTQLSLYNAEVQFSIDCVLNDSTYFAAYGLVDIFAPQLIPYIPSGTKIPLGNPTVYKAMSDFQNDANKSYPISPAVGGTNWRAQLTDVVIFAWDYASATGIRADYGMEIHVYLENNIPHDGWSATSTFYCISENLM